ncbi:hypothetical protein CBS101457_006011 [Exobasidium rhododendri]|nr:hypothetical protein CBS101457_006011 [Exobasidium rhododendri]
MTTTTSRTRDGKGLHGKRSQKKAQISRLAEREARIPWKAVPLPQEAMASGGQSEADFYKGLDFDDDEFMGIKEVEGVDVVRGVGGTVSFVVNEGLQPKSIAKSAKKPAAKKRKIVDEQEEISDIEEEVEKPQEEAQEISEDGEALSDVIFEEDEDSAEDEDEEGVEAAKDSHENVEFNNEDHFADFRVLMEDSPEKVESGTWSKKAYGKKLSGWNKVDISLHDRLKTSLFTLSFLTPTPIQLQSLPHAMPNRTALRDVVGIAQTGSGKTLAYSLPILQWIAENSLDDRQMKLMDGVSEEEEGVRLAGLIIAPTRELALQVTNHLEAFIAASSSDDKNKWASVATLTGGISEEKQRRLVLGHKGRGADIIVATPGRLWDMCKSDDTLTKRIKLTRFLVVDEADRMIESGHFVEMENILALVKRSEKQDDADYQATASISGGSADLQTFIFSATLSKDLQKNLKKSNRKRKGKKASTLDDLFSMIDFRDDDPRVVDLSTKTRLAAGLIESKLECLNKDKDLYLYYFLLRYPGRTLVFLNSIDGIRRLQPLLENLQLSVQPLHSQLQQKQRLKNLDRFKATRTTSTQGSSILLATDVAARGLDITNVDHVVHFQLPRTADTYVHRSGRTARAGQSGISLALVEPAEKKLWRDLCRSLTRSDDTPTLPIEYSFLPALKERVALARELDKYTHTEKKSAHDDAWIRKMAKDADLDVSEEEVDLDAPRNSRKVGNGSDGKKLQSLKSKLEQCLRQPLSARGLSFKYITSGSSDFVQSLLNNKQHGQMIGIQSTTAEDDLQEQKANPVASVSGKRKRR